jgi:hypothetical protein
LGGKQTPSFTKNQSEQYYLKANDVALAQIKGSDIQINNRRSEPFRLAELENNKLYNLITRLAGSANNVNYGFPFLKESPNTFDWYSLYVQLINEKEDYHKLIKEKKEFNSHR